MEFEDNFPTREQTKQLCELGYPQKGFYDFDHTTHEYIILRFHKGEQNELSINDIKDNHTIVPTVSEMADWLYSQKLPKYDSFKVDFWGKEKGWMFQYFQGSYDGEGDNCIQQFYPTLAQAYAAACIYVLKQQSNNL